MLDVYVVLPSNDRKPAPPGLRKQLVGILAPCQWDALLARRSVVIEPPPGLSASLPAGARILVRDEPGDCERPPLCRPFRGV